MNSKITSSIYSVLFISTLISFQSFSDESNIREHINIDGKDYRLIPDELLKDGGLFRQYKGIFTTEEISQGVPQWTGEVILFVKNKKVIQTILDEFDLTLTWEQDHSVDGSVLVTATAIDKTEVRSRGHYLYELINRINDHQDVVHAELDRRKQNTVCHVKF